MVGRDGRARNLLHFRSWQDGSWGVDTILKAPTITISLYISFSCRQICPPKIPFYHRGLYRIYISFWLYGGSSSFLGWGWRLTLEEGEEGLFRAPPRTEWAWERMGGLMGGRPKEARGEKERLDSALME